MRIPTIIAALLLLPKTSLAATTIPSDANFAWLVLRLLEIINVIIPLIFAGAFIMLGWGIIKTWIMGAGDASQVEKGKTFVVIAIIVLVVMTGIWGILAILRNTFFGSFNP